MFWPCDRSAVVPRVDQTIDNVCQISVVSSTSLDEDVLVKSRRNQPPTSLIEPEGSNIDVMTNTSSFGTSANCYSAWLVLLLDDTKLTVGFKFRPD